MKNMGGDDSVTAFVYTSFRTTELLCDDLVIETTQRKQESRHYTIEAFTDVPRSESMLVDKRIDNEADASSLSSDVPIADEGNRLMLALQQGDPSALGGLLDLYNTRLFNFILRIVRNPETTEDIVQETWLSVYESRDRYQTTYRFSTWLFTIARRKALSELRRRKVRSIVRSLKGGRPGEEEITLELPQQTFHQPDAIASGSILSKIIDQAMGRLTPHQREIVMLRDVEGLENEEVAQVLGWNLKPGAIRKRVFDARAAFRREIDKLGVNGEFVTEEQEPERE